MDMRDIFEMQAKRKNDLRKSPLYTRQGLKCMAKEFGVELKSVQTTWTTEEGVDTWALNIGDFMLFPATVQKKSIRGTEFLDGWVVERVHVSFSFSNDSPFYEDVDSEKMYETPSWVHALEYLIVEGFKNKVGYAMEAHGTAYEFGGSKDNG